ncbi:hypothetical protein SARC_05571 [Sphaeroforma arctica JP610]|uniref:Ion transport domain-containing protein n=1 Tax=Sphaeroforma arctica JP610 TaxID=667725 RepID=A0A0L0G1S2_9EUKA|nr:hypothetical protein SARC_05571 [Sphaeroforma arctica JP610]KNC82133.1 hypothetical protein SARC_05571 [Sphaeroforma arctica JP610]|eukprot:XP_014156035.1 hypothetical protein SARC_05571 [Sphaeroforma arctica JP610]
MPTSSESAPLLAGHGRSDPEREPSRVPQGDRPRTANSDAATRRWGRAVNVAKALTKSKVTRRKRTDSRQPASRSSADGSTDVRVVLNDDPGVVSTLPGDLPDPHPKRKYSLLYRVLCGRSHLWLARWVNMALAILILINAVAFILASVETFAEKYEAPLDVLEGISSTIYLIEYSLRVYTITESTYYRPYGPIKGRLYYIFTFNALIDLIACLPFFIEVFTLYELPSLTYLRALRLTRILKTERYTRAFSSVYRIVWYNGEILGLCLFLSMILMLFTSTLLYYLRPGTEPAAALTAMTNHVYSAMGGDVNNSISQATNDADPSDFSSIPATFYLSVLMLTGQGQPEGYMPWYTKTVCALTAIFSVAIFAIPASMLTWGFEAEAERIMRKARDKRIEIEAIRSARRAVIEAAVANGEQPPEALAEFDAQSTSDYDTSTGDSSFDSELSATDESSSTDSWDEYEKAALGDDDAADPTPGPSTISAFPAPVPESPLIFSSPRRAPKRTHSGKDTPVLRVGAMLGELSLAASVATAKSPAPGAERRLSVGPGDGKTTKLLCECCCTGQCRGTTEMKEMHEKLAGIEQQLALLLEKVSGIV